MISLCKNAIFSNNQKLPPAAGEMTNGIAATVSMRRSFPNQLKKHNSILLGRGRAPTTCMVRGLVSAPRALPVWVSWRFELNAMMRGPALTIQTADGFGLNSMVRVPALTIQIAAGFELNSMVRVPALTIHIAVGCLCKFSARSKLNCIL